MISSQQKLFSDLMINPVQRDPGGLAQGFVDLDLGCSTILPGQ